MEPCFVQRKENTKTLRTRCWDLLLSKRFDSDSREANRQTWAVFYTEDFTGDLDWKQKDKNKRNTVCFTNYFLSIGLLYKLVNHLLRVDSVFSRMCSGRFSHFFLLNAVNVCLHLYFWWLMRRFQHFISFLSCLLIHLNTKQIKRVDITLIPTHRMDRC